LFANDEHAMLQAVDAMAKRIVIDQCFPQLRTIRILAEIELAAARIEYWKYLRPGLRVRRCCCQHRQPRDCDQRKVQCFAQALRCAESNAHAGKRSGSVDDADRVKFGECDACLPRQLAHGSDKFFRSAAAWQCRADDTRRTITGICDGDAS